MWFNFQIHNTFKFKYDCFFITDMNRSDRLSKLFQCDYIMTVISYNIIDNFENMTAKIKKYNIYLTKM